MGFPIRTSPDHSVFAAPRSLSQLTTSFFAYRCQGIHRALVLCLTKKLVTTHVLADVSARIAFPLNYATFKDPPHRSRLGGIVGENGNRRPWPTLVGVPGFEPGTSSLSGTRSNQLSYTPFGRAWRCRPHNIRTSPVDLPTAHRFRRMVEATGFEPVTPSLQSSCSTN